MSALITIEDVKSVDVFTGEKMDKLLGKIREAATSGEIDLTTVKGRKAIASRAHAVSKSKVVIDDAGKALVADWKAQSAKVDAVRRSVRDSLDDLRDEVRKPLTDWESEEAAKAEAARLEAERIEAERIAKIEAERAAAEAAMAARERKVREAQEKLERDAEELRLREQAAIAKAAAEKAEDERIARERIEAENRAKAEAEARVKREAEAAAKAEADQKAAVERARQEERDAQARREQEARQAELAEQARLRALERDKANRDRVHVAIMEGFERAGLKAEDARAAMEAVAAGTMPYISVDYSDLPTSASAA